MLQIDILPNFILLKNSFAYYLIGFVKKNEIFFENLL